MVSDESKTPLNLDSNSKFTEINNGNITTNEIFAKKLLKGGDARLNNIYAKGDIYSDNIFTLGDISTNDITSKNLTLRQTQVFHLKE